VRGIVAEHAEICKKWLLIAMTWKRDSRWTCPSLFTGIHFSQRISSRRSCFTINGSDPNGFERIFAAPFQAVARINTQSQGNFNERRTVGFKSFSH
jgi:hypothetical protein